jgi:hypothetical protein
MKGNIKTGTLYIVLIMVVLGFMGAELTQGLVPSNLPNNTGQIVVPVTAVPASGKNNLQLYTFGFITATPSPTPQSVSCPNDDIKPPACGICPNFDAAACPKTATPCDTGGRVMRLPASDPSSSEYCVYVRDNNEDLYNQKLTTPDCAAACVSSRN